MAEGIRIQPRPDLGWPLGPAMVIIRDHDRPIPPALDGEGRIIPLEQTQPVCHICEAAGNPPQHWCKTYHIQLEPDGTQIVSAGVWAGLQRCADNPFEIVNTVTKPPTQHLALAAPSLR